MKNDRFSVLTHSPEETREIGKIVGSVAMPGSVIALTGELGAGKTCFIQGVARGVGTPDDYYITSPTYTIINEYPGRLPFFHIDLYRVSDPFELEQIGFYEKLEQNGLAAIEWADRLGENFFKKKILNIHIEAADDQKRKFVFFSGHEWQNLLIAPIQRYGENIREIR